MLAKDESIREGELMTSDRETLSRKEQDPMQTWRQFSEWKTDSCSPSYNQEDEVNGHRQVGG